MSQPNGYVFTWPGPTLTCDLCDGYGWVSARKDSTNKKCPWSFTTNVIDGSGWICKKCEGLGNVGPETVKTLPPPPSINAAYQRAYREKQRAGGRLES